jgi:hypothetical protein
MTEGLASVVAHMSDNAGDERALGETTADLRARWIERQLEEHARRRPLVFLDPAAMVDLVHFIATGIIRSYSKDEARSEGFAAMIGKTGEIGTYCPRLFVKE